MANRLNFFIESLIWVEILVENFIVKEFHFVPIFKSPSLAFPSQTEKKTREDLATSPTQSNKIKTDKSINIPLNNRLQYIYLI
ncbi:MAG TPA: hypothetical protein DCE41_08775 [Cytophagales bacterium]|nr:hypothetical protein [Cytophagales bacterium]HAA20135.1 hypothetical protein [Cytophagales bacterium]HAP59965.1 hypothetical protein [Cytophagales bacterium]